MSLLTELNKQLAGLINTTYALYRKSSRHEDKMIWLEYLAELALFIAAIQVEDAIEYKISDFDCKIGSTKMVNKVYFDEFHSQWLALKKRIHELLLEINIQDRLKLLGLDQEYKKLVDEVMQSGHKIKELRRLLAEIMLSAKEINDHIDELVQ